MGTVVNRENLIAWANQQVTENPTRLVPVHTEEGNTAEQVPNTASAELRDLLSAIHQRNFLGGSYSKFELIGMVIDLYQDGVKGYREYTESELADEIVELTKDEEIAPYEPDTLEELLADLDRI